MSRCKSCGAQIEWVKTKSGRMMPLDPGEEEIVLGNGGVMLVTNDGAIIRGFFANELRPGEVRGRGRTSHFATCPGAGLHRKADK